MQVFLPVPEDEFALPPSIDTIYLRGLAWPSVLLPLGASVSEARGIVPPKFLDAWEGDGDCAGARVFDGEYRDLIRTLASAELRFEELVDFLRRETDYLAMRTALAFAAVDVARSSPAVAVVDIAEAILHVGTTDYAAPRTAELPQRLAPKLAKLVLAVPQGERLTLAGPRFVTAEKFRHLKTNAVSVEDDLMVGGGPELVVRLGD